jgi:RES domain-containing protein
VIVHRICKARYANEIFTGNGGLTAAGRWHRKGRRVVYTAQSLSLAAFELFVHLGRHDTTIALVCGRADIPDSVPIETVDRRRLPSNWNESPPNPATAALGDRWLKEKRTAVLQVPAALIPDEHDYLLNPEHPQFLKIVFSKPETFRLDPRVWK